MKLNLHPKGIPKQEPLGADTPLKKGGVVVGMRKEGDKEKIYFVGDDCHLLCVGATRSGKSRCLVLESICLLGLAGESIFCSDPKAELFHYTADFLKKLGYEVLVLDFKNPEKSMRYNLLQPIIDAINEGDTDRAEMLAWDLTNNLVGKPEGEKIWTNGECSIIAAAILCVVCDNQKRPEFQNMTNVYWFISEMCRTIGNKMPLLEYVKKLSPSHPARALLSISDVAPSRTRGSFYTSALTTLRLFTSKSIYAITHTSDFTLADMGSKKQALFVILPDEKTTFYPIASLIVSQQYELLAEAADRRGGRLERRVNFILDEYGNFTPISDMTNKLTVAAGRGMRYTYGQTAVSYFPEFGYGTYWRLLERLTSGTTARFQFAKNIYSTYNQRVHFTPVWFPDGSYTVNTHVMDIWTPAGMLAMNLTDDVTISGSLYDDWHIAPGNP
mgnify:CR=1 FL=1